MIKRTSYISLINYASKVADFKYSNESIKCKCGIKKLFTCNLAKTKEPTLYFSAVLGIYLPQLMYLDKERVINE